MSKSECFEHDIAVRAAWMEKLTEDQLYMLRGDKKTNVGGMVKAQRFEVYKAIDELVKTRYLETLIVANQDPFTVHIKGYGPIRQSKDQLPTDIRMSGVAFDVIAELDFKALTKPKPVAPPVESATE
jgi:hypothetical protein